VAIALYFGEITGINYWTCWYNGSQRFENPPPLLWQVLSFSWLDGSV